MKNHTPGPWTIEGGVSNRVYLLNNAEGHAIGEIIFAETRRRADARLIAAAPDLLAALRGLLICVGPRGDAEPLDAYEDRRRLIKGQIARADAAIAKATT